MITALYFIIGLLFAYMLIAFYRYEEVRSSYVTKTLQVILWIIAWPVLLVASLLFAIVAGMIF